MSNGDPARESTGGSWAAWAVGLALVVAALGAVGWLVQQAQSPPQGVRPIIWDKQACAECKMAISTPAFAAQLQTEDGRVIDFDDPGCLMLYRQREQPRVHALYFHQVDDPDRWLSGDEVAFQPGVHSPMGFNLGAVPRGTPGALSYDEAAGRVLESRQVPVETAK